MPVILAIAVIVTFAGSAAAIRRAVGSILSSRCEVSCEQAHVERRARYCHQPRSSDASFHARAHAGAGSGPAPRTRSFGPFAMVVAAAVTTAMLNLYVDVQAKLRREFRNYGANIILVGKDGASLPADALARVDSVVAGRGIAAPFALIVARTSTGQSIAVAGADFDRVRQLDRWWSVSNWPSASQQALIGVRAQPTVAPKNQPFDLSFQGRPFISLPPAPFKPERRKTAAFIFRWRTSWPGPASTIDH